MPASDGHHPQAGCSCSACTGTALRAPRGDILGPTEVWTVDQLMDQMISGQAWTGTGAGPVVVTYSFPTSPASYGFDYAFGDELASFSPFTAAQRAAAAEILELWAEVANIEFQEVTGGADMRFANTADFESQIYAGAFQPGTGFGGDVWVNASHVSDPLGFGDYGYLALIHEVGHALGLNHPNDYNGSTSQENPTHIFDSRQYTVMSYYPHQAPDSRPVNPSAPLLMDILAVQQIYGVNYETRNGDTTYGFNVTGDVRANFDFSQNSQPIVAIWDGGGIDTLDLSGFAMDQQITLVAGEFSSVGGLTDNLAIAYGAEIENALGGAGDDGIFGNQLANSLSGGGGSDYLSGGAGDDLLGGGDGADTLDGGTGADQLTGAAGDDTYIFAGFGYDVVADLEGSNTLEFSDLACDQLSFEQNGDDLLISTLDGSCSVQVCDYYANQDAYRLQFAGDQPADPGAADDDTFATATDLGLVTAATASSLQDTVGGGDPRDVFQFEIAERQQIRIALQGASGDVDLFLYDEGGNLLAQSVAGGTSLDALAGDIAPGSYFIEVRPYQQADTAYALDIEGAPAGGAGGALPAARPVPAAAAAPLESLALRDMTGLPAAAANDVGLGSRREQGFGEALLAA